MAPRTSIILAAVGATAVVGVAAYAVYFDQKRRSDPAFRKNIKKERKRATKTAKALSASGSEAGGADVEHDFETALEQIRKEPTPTPGQSEQYFMEHVGMGERLAAQGPLFHFPAALSFFRALRVYPSPPELITIYQQTVPPPVFALIMQLMQHELKDRVLGYYEHYPPASMNVQIKELPMMKDGVPATDQPGAPVVRRRALVTKRDFAAGDVIYQENPIVTALDLDLEGKGTHCSHCLRLLEHQMSIIVPNDPLQTTYCSKACQIASFSSSHNLLFGPQPVVELPVESDSIPTLEDITKRQQAQQAFVAHLKETSKLSPLLVAKFIARTISLEVAKLSSLNPDIAAGLPAPPEDLPEPDGPVAGEGYSFYDHIERLRFLEVERSGSEEAEMTLLQDILRGAMSGLETFIQDERYLVLKGKVLFNAIGVSFTGGRLNKPKTGERFEPWDLTRTPYGTSRQTGTAFYRVSSYLAHSCDPSARPSFPKGTAELHLVANRDIKAGEELTISYVRANPTEGETVPDNRRTRRQELARGWRFVCECAKCAKEATLVETSPIVPSLVVDEPTITNTAPETEGKEENEDTKKSEIVSEPKQGED